MQRRATASEKREAADEAVKDFAEDDEQEPVDEADEDFAEEDDDEDEPPSRRRKSKPVGRSRA